MTVTGALARPMLAAIFIYGGVDALRDPEAKAKAADDVAPKIAAALGLPTTDTVTLVRINGGIQVLAGTMLALGKGRRLSALVLAASLIPTTYAGHRFWEEVDEERRAQQRIQFLKNLAMLGGLVLAASDTGGRPSVPWQARRAAKHAIEATVAATAVTEEAARHIVESAKHARGVEIAGPAHDLAQAVKESELSKRAMKAAKKAKKAKFTRRALKAQAKAAAKAGAKAGARAARRAKKTQLGVNAASAASKVHQAASDGFDRAWEVAGDGAAGRLRDNAASVATSVAHQVSELTRDALTLAS